jgi:hypothetical protein
MINFDNKGDMMKSLMLIATIFFVISCSNDLVTVNEPTGIDKFLPVETEVTKSTQACSNKNACK